MKIKAEVADSNTQAQKLSQYNTELERRIDACLHPNIDKESVTPTQLYESLKVRMRVKSGYLQSSSCVCYSSLCVAVDGWLLQFVFSS